MRTVDELVPLFSVSFKAMEELAPGEDKAIALAFFGLAIDGGHHKQWFLEQILFALGVDEAVFKSLTTDDEGRWFQKGITP